jgi:hypothetical protein
VTRFVKSLINTCFLNVLKGRASHHFFTSEKVTMDLLPNNVLSYVFYRMKRNSLYKMAILGKVPEFMWRVVFFDILKFPAGSWLDACKLLVQIGDVYMVRCYQCSWYKTRSISRPTECITCQKTVSTKDTYIVTYPDSAM